MTSFWKTSSLVLLAPLLGIASAAVEPTVTLDTGVYHGVPTQRPGSSKVIHKYLGIPFAAPPVRFSPPKPLATSSTFKHATALPPACPQNGGGSFLSPEGTPESEDCLYLNLFAPAPTNATSSDGGKAVMVWFFGGALQFGTGSLPGYDGTSFATNQDIILIAPNYRTNVFGFPGEIPGVSEKERNLGFLDQRMALDWVQKNIKKFGGDPSKVTIFGESAGARSVDFHLLTTPNNPPFRGVIMQSGSSHITPGVQPKGTTTTKRAPMFISLAISVGCTDLEKVVECMRKLPFATVKNAVASGPFQFGASDDGLTVVRDAEAARRDHRVANVSLLIGTNADEQKATMRAQQRTPLAQYIGSTFGADAELKEKIAKGYPVGPNSLYKTEYDAMVAIATDMGFTCVTSRESKVSAEAGYPTWRFLFNASYPNTEQFPGSGAYHSAEIQFVFGNLRTPKGPSLPEELSLSQAMQSAWAKFAKDPAGGPGWEKVGTKGGKDLGHFNYNGKLIVESPAYLDRNCPLFEKAISSRDSG